MIVELMKHKININLIYEIKNLNKYKSSGLYEYEIISTKDIYTLDELIPFKINENKKLYKKDNIIIQEQLDSGNVIGYIEYIDKLVKIYLLKDDANTEYLLSQYAIDYLICKYFGGILFHSSIVIKDDICVAFTAPSGTGKSTMRRKWCQNGAICINDDKNALILENDNLVVYPTPWSGKHHLDNNIFHKLDAIVFLSQARNNEFYEIKLADAFKKILQQIDLAYDYNKDLWNRIVDKMLELKLYSYGCNLKMEAFDKLYERIVNDYANK